MESWNGFVQWAAFGGEGIIRQNNREEQRKIIRYNHLVANLVVFHNVVSMTRGLQELVDEDYTVTPEIVARLSPYKTEHINRFGSYELHFDHVPPPVLGVGQMGMGMDRHLLAAGYDVLAYDVATPPLERFVGQGGRQASHPAQIGAECQRVLVMVVNGA